MGAGIARHFQRFMGVGQGHAVVRLPRRRELRARALQGGIGHLDELPGRRGPARHLLFESHRPHRRGIDVAGIQGHFPQQRAQQGRLAAAVGADERDPLAGRNGGIGIFDQGPGTARQRQPAQTDHGPTQSDKASRVIATIIRSPADTGT